MRARLYGRIDTPAVVAIGVWDPIMRPHRELFVRLAAHAARGGLASAVIALDPDPVRHLYGPHDVPVYNDPASRVRQLLGAGLDAVVKVRFTRDDVDGGAEALFTAVEPHVRIAELWLGARQTLGRFDRGSFSTIQRLADERDMRVTRLPHTPLRTRAVREHLREGALRPAIRVVGRPPFRMRPRSGSVALAWSTGHYEGVAVEDPTADVAGSVHRLEVLPRASRLPALEWPDPGIKYLAFVSGPGDAATRRRRAQHARGSPRR